MELRSVVLTGAVLDPGRGFERVRTTVEVRWDPLTGQTSRLATGTRPLLPPGDVDLEQLADQTRPTCPFCPERLEQATPKLPGELHPHGRIRRGQAVLFPNLFPYAQYSSVSVYAPSRHLLPLGQVTPRLVADNLATQVQFAQAVMGHDAAARWASINANHLPPSGSSVFHPHLQGNLHPLPTTMQRLLAEVPAARFRDYLDTEQRLGRRWLGSTGRVAWLASFAPLAPAELRAFVAGVASPVELDDELVAELGHGIASALHFYAELGFASFNLALYGAPPKTDGYPLNLRLACRSNPAPFYRSDAQYLERLHWEAAVDIMPERLAEQAGDRFRR